MGHGPISSNSPGHGPLVTRPPDKTQAGAIVRELLEDAEKDRPVRTRADNPVSPEEFWNEFIQVAVEFKRKLEKSRTPGIWTERFLNESKGLLAAVAAKLGLKYCGEYFRIDAIMCENIDSDNFVPDDWWAAEHLAVVVEHENNPKGAEKEMNKLTIFNSPLKVLITYPHESYAQQYLDAYSDIVKRADIFRDFSTKRKHLVIFGFDWDRDLRWEGYVYEKAKFVPLQVAL